MNFEVGRKLILSLILVFVTASSFAQTTFILVRHAEKENTANNDPALTTEGQERAQRLAQMLEKQNIDHVLSTDFKRTMNTVGPLAKSRGLMIQVYKSVNPADWITDKPRTIVVSGHSNTIPALANQILGREQFKNFEDSDYGNILISTATAVGKATVTHLRY